MSRQWHVVIRIVIFIIMFCSSIRCFKQIYLNKRLKSRIKSQSNIRSWPIKNESPPEVLFRFGIIADIQYADADDAPNFQGTMIRRYRKSLLTYSKAIKYWNNMLTTSTSIPFKCAIVLGDILDGKTALMKNQEQCYNDFLQISSLSKIDSFYCFGNHCHYSFNRTQIYDKYLSPLTHILSSNSTIGGVCSPSELYYDYSPYPGWRFVFIDGYDISSIGASSEENRLLSHTLLSTHNPNDLNISGGWFNNLPYHKRRWVPYNGGVSQKQLEWLDSVLTESVQRGEQVIAFCHQPIYAPDKPQSLVWNAEEILALLHSHGNTRLWVAGHDHGGQYGIDTGGICHLVPPAPIESPEGDLTFGHIDVCGDKLHLHWQGEVPADTVLPFPTVMRLYNNK